MWTCRQCGEENEDQFGACWSCSTVRSETDAVTEGGKEAPHEEAQEREIGEGGRGSRRGRRSPRMPASAASREQMRRSTRGGADESQRIAERYDDAYGVAAFLIRLGKAIKLAAALVGVAIPSLAVAGAGRVGDGGAALVWGLVGAAVVAGAGYCIGVLVSAAGQMHQALIDTAVNTCPFLSADEKSAVIGL